MSPCGSPWKQLRSERDPQLLFPVFPGVWWLLITALLLVLHQSSGPMAAVGLPLSVPHLEGAQHDVIRRALMHGERIASQSEVIRAIVSGYSPCDGVPHQSVGLAGVPTA